MTTQRLETLARKMNRVQLALVLCDAFGGLVCEGKVTYAKMRDMWIGAAEWQRVAAEQLAVKRFG